MNTAKTAALVADFSDCRGKINRLLHCSNYMPNISSQNIFDFSGDFSKLHFTTARTHDQALINPGQRVVDTHFIFSRFDADAADPDNYYFDATDYLLQTCIDCGTEIYFRLGTSIEHTFDHRHFNTVKPADYLQYARILAGIIRHYNYGWANGFYMNIPFWEIWNEPDIGKKCWDGTQEEFIDFFCTVLEYLKKEFPKEIIGGPALCRADHEYITKLLKECSRRSIAPDFISYHAYWYEPAPLIKVSFEVRELLDGLGFRETRLHLNEWHYVKSWDGILRNVTPENYHNAMFGDAGMHGCDSAAYNVALFIGWHDSPLDCACYYGAGNPRNFSAFGLHDQYLNPDKNYYSMKMIGETVFDYSRRYAVDGVNEKLWMLPVTDESGKKGAVLISDFNSGCTDIILELKNLPQIRNISCRLLDREHNEVNIPVEAVDNKLVVSKKHQCSSVFLITFDI